jgi:asparagine synthase (glutamine-hydrolysing)
MCGITGFIEKTEKKIAESNLRLMVKQIRHRGPDSNGIWYDESNGIGLAHARLSILDLTSAGHQPMVSYSGRYVISFNGEIYNHSSIRAELESDSDSCHVCTWRGYSDTETLLAAIEIWGLRKTLSKCTGMFAISLWDKKLKTLNLVRDRLGEKPLYYGWIDNIFLFGSELKSLKAHNIFSGEIDREALQVYLRLMSIPAPLTIYKNIKKVEPGQIVTINKNGIVETKFFWSTSNSIKKSIGKKKSLIYDQSVNELDLLLTNIIDKQLIADVPVGAFLSGGVDSSLVVAIMNKISTSKVETFSIGFDDQRYDESQYAKDVAKYIGTNHNTLRVTKGMLLDVVLKLPSIYDEPFADSSQIPTYLVSKFASESVKVALTGDGADELFGGYNRYTMTNQYWKNICKTPRFIRKFTALGLNSLSPSSWDRVFNSIRLVRPDMKIEMIGEKIKKASNILSQDNDHELYKSLVSIENEPSKFLINSKLVGFIDKEHDRFDYLSSAVEKMMALDLSIYLPTDILTKVDRASMANSLETRVPFLDHSLVDFAWSLPLEFKIKKNTGKKIVRDVLDKYVPFHLLDRPKRGFGVPVDAWLRYELRDWAEELLSVDRLKKDGFFNVKNVRDMWNDHLDVKNNNANKLWSILMFQSWLDLESKS